MRPSVGTWCLICLAAGHKCQSQICVSGDPLCLPCADGDPCSFVRVAIKAQISKPDVFDVIIPMRAKESPILKAILPSSAVGEGADARNSARMRAALGPKVSEVLIAQAHDDIRSGRHLERKPRAQKPATVALKEKSGARVPKKSQAREAPTAAPQLKPSKPEGETKVENKLTPEVKEQVVAEWKLGTTINSIAVKYGITWYEASQLKPKAISAKLGESPAPKPRPVAETPFTMKEVFDEVFPAKPESWVGRTTQEVRDSCGHAHADTHKCFDCGLVFPRPEQVNVPNPVLPKIKSQVDALVDTLRPITQRVSINIGLSEAEAVAVFEILSPEQKGEALRSVLSGLLRTS